MERDLVQMERSGRAQLAGWVENNLPPLIEGACTQIVARVPDYYGRSESVVSMDELNRSVERNLRSLVQALGNPQAPIDLSAPEKTGARRAHQGVPLPEVLRAYRISFATVWDAMVDHVHRSRQPALTEALIVIASMIWRFTDEHAVALTESYRAATAEMLLAQQRRRAALVEALLSGRPGPESGPWEAAALLGFPPDASLAVAVADARGLAEEAMPNVEQRLAEHGIVSGWRLTPVQQLGIVAFQADGFGAVIEALEQIATGRTGMSPPYRSLPDTPRAFRLAQAALAGMPAGEVGVRVFDRSPLAALMVSDPAESRRLGEQVLGAVLQQPTEDRELLLETLTVYLDHAGSAEQAAEILYCHPNTVRNRLRRIQELTGRSFTEPMDLAELTSASYAMRLEHTTTLVSGDHPPAPGYVLMRRPPTNGHR